MQLNPERRSQLGRLLLCCLAAASLAAQLLLCLLLTSDIPIHVEDDEFIFYMGFSAGTLALSVFTLLRLRSKDLLAVMTAASALLLVGWTMFAAGLLTLLESNAIVAYMEAAGWLTSAIILALSVLRYRQI
ncbi:hypothetical protein DNH61_05975 [Paenibacillus sambharensis]|uniref:Uncharacterized protein n=1 Tax=Paenibacillus sambharensis TaxID=1803190 RepID=A0A2W1LD66_9BACL|nr:hypothetical protein [Paenibacillus sambharensis]PZD96743.1 hypothetical protein DNH61_05975 [Paenibacillus sambharensis]